MEELLSSLFFLYILGSIVAGLFRRGSRSGDGGQGAAGEARRPGFPDVLDMDDLERRLREIRSGKREPDTAMAPSPVPQTSAPAPAPQPTPPLSPARPTERPQPEQWPTIASSAQPGSTAVPLSRQQQGIDGSVDSVDDWSEFPDEGLETVPAATAQPRRSVRAGQLPAAVETIIRRGNPWQAAFVLKELLGPPRALHPHRRRPPF